MENTPDTEFRSADTNKNNRRATDVAAQENYDTNSLRAVQNDEPDSPEFTDEEIERQIMAEETTAAFEAENYGLPKETTPSDEYKIAYREFDPTETDIQLVEHWRNNGGTLPPRGYF